MKHIKITTEKLISGQWMVGLYNTETMTEIGSFTTNDATLIDDISEMNIDGYESELRWHETFDDVKETCFNKMDLFENYDQQPKELQEICDKWLVQEELNELDYDDCKQFLTELEAIGYTFEYGLDAIPFNLKKI